ncbi:MAG TPA: hypothetical protein VKE98_17720 [Gemmataceae bacterium]|nr:hypothetical protein [Gemmataceae bacterium]
MIGDPFRPVSLDPAWLTPAVTSVVKVIYDERRFEDLPILADALEDASCGDQHRAVRASRRPLVCPEGAICAQAVHEVAG